MADYYPLIARAVASLERNTGENRRALYERARTALVAQLRGVVPALAESDITRERLALEEAIRKVEGEAARRARMEQTPSSTPRPPEPPRPPRREMGAPPPRVSPPPLRRSAGNETTTESPRVETQRPQPPQPEPQRPQSSSPFPQRPEPQRPQPPSPFSPRFEPPRAEPSGSEPPRAPALPHAEPPMPRFQPPHTRPNVNPSAEAGIEPRVAPPRAGQGWTPAARTEPPAPNEQLWEHPSYGPHPTEPVRTPPLRGEALRNLADSAEPGGRRGPPRPRIATAEPEQEWPESQAFDRIEPQIINEDFEGQQRGTYPEAVEPVYDGPRFGTRARRVAQRDDDDQPAIKPSRAVSYWRIAKIVLLVIALAGLSSFAYWQRTNIISLYQAFRGHSGPPAREAATNGRPKISDRIGEAAPGAARPGAGSSAQSGPAVAQRVVLYEEEANNPQGKRYVGSAVWRTETGSPGAGQPPQFTVRADVEIPDRRMTMTFSIRRNLDQTLPASHTIEITFNIPADFPGGGIGNVPGVLMKQAEQTRGVPLAGLAVKVTTGFFLIGLSAVDADVQRNVQLLKERAWFDIPLVYSNNQRAILAIEKGTPGEHAFDQAFANWDRSGTSSR
ncbi:MAG: hypothetical protein HY659_07505 [Rhizobiales bacterium]|nr:hypothetical protein [Hyphomicrobiales bacterium]